MSFEASATFTGSRPGAAFKMGPEGLGYYADPHQPAEPAAKASEDRDRRPRDRDRDRDRDRGRDRDRDRDRRGRDSGGHGGGYSHDSRGGQDRERGRDRDRDRRDRSRRGGDDDRDSSYSHSRDNNDRRRGRSRSRSRDRSQRDRRDSRGRPEATESPPPAATTEADAPGFSFTAAQVAERYVEVFSAESKRRGESLLECLDLAAITVIAVEGGDLRAEGEAELGLHCKTVPVWKAEAAKRLYIEGNKASDPTYCVDFYLKGQSPGWSLEGLASETPERSDIWVLYTVKANKIACVHVGDDTKRVGRNVGATEEDVYASEVFLKVLDIAVRPGGLTGTEITKHYHDYSKIEVWG